MRLNKDQVLQYLPHRDPFLFIDEVESIVLQDSSKNDLPTVSLEDLVGCEITANYFVSSQMDVFRGHFPNEPILPGVLQIEMMAQAACFGVFKLFVNPYQQPVAVALAKVEEAKFRKPILPNTALKIQAKCLKFRGNMVWYECQIQAEQEIKAQATIMASFKTKL